MATPEASVHPVRNCLCYHFSLYQTNKSCSQSFSRRKMLLRRFNKICLQVTAPNATEAERPFYERSRMVLHITRRLLLQLLASVLFSHVRSQIFDGSYQFDLCRLYYWGQGNWIASLEQLGSYQSTWSCVTAELYPVQSIQTLNALSHIALSSWRVCFVFCMPCTEFERDARKIHRYNLQPVDKVYIMDMFHMHSNTGCALSGPTCILHQMALSDWWNMIIILPLDCVCIFSIYWLYYHKQLISY